MSRSRDDSRDGVILRLVHDPILTREIRRISKDVDNLHPWM